MTNGANKHRPLFSLQPEAGGRYTQNRPDGNEKRQHSKVPSATR